MDKHNTRNISSSFSCDYNLKTCEKDSEYLYDELSKILQKEIDNELISQILENQGWFRVTLKRWDTIDIEWCKKYMKGEYRSHGHHWLFKDRQDFILFSLKWQ